MVQAVNSICIPSPPLVVVPAADPSVYILAHEAEEYLSFSIFKARNLIKWGLQGSLLRPETVITISGLGKESHGADLFVILIDSIFTELRLSSETSLVILWNGLTCLILLQFLSCILSSKVHGCHEVVSSFLLILSLYFICILVI